MKIISTLNNQQHANAVFHAAVAEKVLKKTKQKHKNKKCMNIKTKKTQYI